MHERGGPPARARRGAAERRHGRGEGGAAGRHGGGAKAARGERRGRVANGFQWREAFRVFMPDGTEL